MTPDEFAISQYQAYVVTESRPGQTVAIAAARRHVEQRIEAAVAAGELSEAELRSLAARMLSQRAHERVTDAGKRLLQAKADGQQGFGALLDEVIVPLGEGQLCLYGDLSAVTLTMADRPRFENLVSVQEEYAAWRRKHLDPAMPVLVQDGGTIRDAVARGRLLP